MEFFQLFSSQSSFDAFSESFNQRIDGTASRLHEVIRVTQEERAARRDSEQRLAKQLSDVCSKASLNELSQLSVSQRSVAEQSASLVEERLRSELRELSVTLGQIDQLYF